MTSLYLSAFTLFWTTFAVSNLLWALQRRRWHAEAVRRIVIE